MNEPLRLENEPVRLEKDEFYAFEALKQGVRPIDTTLVDQKDADENGNFWRSYTENPDALEAVTDTNAYLCRVLGWTPERASKSIDKLASLGLTWRRG